MRSIDGTSRENAYRPVVFSLCVRVMETARRNSRHRFDVLLFLIVTCG